ncbi:methyl-accepting chemotaxis sensory transducer [Afipia carboxidovorans OM5]|uniref:Putative chemotaxis sensory transducer n=1 Tax=Afipia carboxidovorans (strain ATCC 49405 / DSM 1227 / KCTC 32145 / OM5) TaxID=504832 RepID=B6JFI7_AFIC5|nr:MCP four helix bundle domain-containing protein [Afipia carboxidovorans]ACI94007.1 methyl-accepting chemotaxis sensory transducer [Afipia carboxidovorans OM5]AEI02325.1 putative chemotaxis sensory transducer [Afipia carboxidovorans OM4]AEI05901.1 putative chemotaxis sensory transducer [Afipia carboxidovorans OM5]
MLSRLSISAKLITLVSVLLLSLAALGTFSIVEMRTINASTQEIRTNWLPSIRYLGEMRTQAARFRAVLRDTLTEPDEAFMADIMKNLTARARDFDKAFEGYGALISSPAEREMYADLDASWKKFRASADEVVELAKKKDVAGARKLNAEKSVKIGRAMDGALAKIVALNDQSADAAGNQATEDYNIGSMIVIGALAIMILIGAGAAFLIVRDVAHSIGSVIKPMEMLAEGDLSAEIPQQSEKTEIGKIAATLQVFKNALVAKKAADIAAAEEASAKVKRAEMVDGITREFETMIGELVTSLSSASTEMESSAGTLTKAADVTQQLSTSAANGSRTVSESIQSTAAATEEITSSVGEIGRQVMESSRVAQRAVQQAEKTNASISELSAAAARIGDVVKLITAIAEQTNLLALNATIEAARAGEAGRGFAVVASEVKALASQTAKATDEIGAQIAGMQAATDDSVVTIKEISATIDQISEISSAIAAAVEEQGAATQEIARNVRQAAELCSQVAVNIDEVHRGNSETGAASSQVFSAAQSLAQESTRLEVEVQNFIGQIRAA